MDMTLSISTAEPQAEPDLLFTTDNPSVLRAALQAVNVDDKPIATSTTPVTVYALKGAKNEGIVFATKNPEMTFECAAILGAQWPAMTDAEQSQYLASQAVSPTALAGYLGITSLFVRCAPPLRPGSGTTSAEEAAQREGEPGSLKISSSFVPTTFECKRLASVLQTHDAVTRALTAVYNPAFVEPQLLRSALQTSSALAPPACVSLALSIGSIEVEIAASDRVHNALHARPTIGTVAPVPKLQARHGATIPTLAKLEEEAATALPPIESSDASLLKLRGEGPTRLQATAYSLLHCTSERDAKLSITVRVVPAGVGTRHLRDVAGVEIIMRVVTQQQCVARATAQFRAGADVAGEVVTESGREDLECVMQTLNFTHSYFGRDLKHALHSFERTDNAILAFSSDGTLDIGSAIEVAAPVRPSLIILRSRLAAIETAL